MRVLIEKSLRRLTLFDDENRALLQCPAGLGRAEGPKKRAGDFRTPEGAYYVCLVKENGCTPLTTADKQLIIL